jgi:putative spermidine/putrescine transport system permease protein
MTVAADLPRVSRSPGRRLSSWLHRRPRARLGGLLTLPLLWLGALYFAALFALLSTAFFSVDEFTNAVVRTFTLSNFQDLLTDPAYAKATARTVGIAATVTVLCITLGVPMAFFMAKIAKPRSRGLLVALVVTPLWASYLVKVYAWQAMVQPETGVIAWALKPFGLSGPGYGIVAVILTLTYLWLPYMILPVYAGLERLPDSLVDASGDLGARPGRTFRSVVIPLIYPSVIAGSIFTFSLSLGDYITVQIVGGKTQMLGNIVYQNYTSNLPFAAAVAVIPVAIMVVYLMLVRRTGALENL